MRPLTGDDCEKTDLFGGVLTSLDPQRTSRHRIASGEVEEVIDPDAYRRREHQRRRSAVEVHRAEPIETAFRHRGWVADRARVRAALVRTGCPAARLEKFDNCGAACRVEIAQGGGRVRLRASYCGDRWCVPCCKARARRIVGNLTGLAEGQRITFATFTARPAAADLASCLRHVLASFNRLRHAQEWRAAVQGGAFTVEITRGRRGDHWHVHVHCLYAGKWIDQRRLSELWRVASRGSYVVDIRAARHDRRHVEYLASYAAKGWSRDTLNDADHVDESMIALKGRRLIAAFGSWYGVELLDAPPDDTVFTSVGSLTSIVAAAQNGQEWAVGILHALGVRVGPAGSGVAFAKSDRSP